jgi:hypothetical protein
LGWSPIRKGTENKRREDNRSEEKRKKIREEMRRQGKRTEINCEGFAPYATTKIFDICGGGAGRLMRGRGGFGLATYKKGNSK